MAPTAFDLAQGGAVGRYHVLTRLSVGGMSEIFLAVAPAPGGRALLALKRILPELQQDDEFIKMFLDEARISTSLSHPNIARVFELGREAGELFMAMEYVPGQSLAAIIKATRKANRMV